MKNTSNTLTKAVSFLSSPREVIKYVSYKTAPAWGMPMSIFRARNIAMFHMGRCGSSVLGDLLYQHSRIQWNGEIYCPYIHDWRTQTTQNPKTPTLTPDPLMLLQRKMFAAGSKNFGCEIKFHHLVEGHIDIEKFIEILNKKDFYYIILRRKNFLRSIISHTVMYSLAEKKTHNKSSEKATLKQVNIDVKNTGYNGTKKTLLEHLNMQKENHIYLEKLLANQKYLKLNFEDDIAENPNNAYLQVCDFLNIEPEETPVRLSRTNPFPLSEIIINYGEVKEYLKDTEYAWMCD
ncbi:hypothetical protein QGP82_31870 [Leptothoe sp. LEGE 181152]|nr:hypothetical protein [Leptothoe sp. LEGE 181152]